jgi:hypothetical protein
MKKKTNQDVLKDYIDSVDGKITEQTKKTYTYISNNLPFSILTTQPTIIKKLKNLYPNPNTKALNLNMIIITRRANKEPTDALIKYRNSLRDDIIQLRKERMSEIKNNLPSYNNLLEELNQMEGLRYITNYLLMNYGFRNKELNLKYVDTIPEDKEDENYISLNKNKVILDINDFKTDKSYGNKTMEIKDKKFIKELKSLNFKDGVYIISKKNGDKLKPSTFNERILNISIQKLGEAKMFKILIAHLLDNKDFNKIEKLVKTRGTSMATILKSYNIYNNDENNENNNLDE